MTSGFSSPLRAFLSQLIVTHIFLMSCLLQTCSIIPTSHNRHSPVPDYCRSSVMSCGASAAPSVELSQRGQEVGEVRAMAIHVRSEDTVRFQRFHGIHRGAGVVR
jgi:hypothetical protein